MGLKHAWASFWAALLTLGHALSCLTYRKKSNFKMFLIATIINHFSSHICTSPMDQSNAYISNNTFQSSTYTGLSFGDALQKNILFLFYPYTKTCNNALKNALWLALVSREK